ncbi:MAG: hypothetical protein N2376_09685, partial [Clostridia bacterium]|nr:hypothetical protein [Clostridia bacterium]
DVYKRQPFTIEITGPAQNPVVTVGAAELSYSGAIPAGETLVIWSNVSAGTVRLGNSNGRANYCGLFPGLAPGETSIEADTNVTVRWRDRWI